MKKLLFLLMLSVSLLASQAQTEREIYNVILHSIVPEKIKLHIWSDSVSLSKNLQTLDSVDIVRNIEDADIAIVSQPATKVDCDCLLFVTSYPLLKKYKNKAVGGFFWLKGRPNILFLRSNLQKNGIKLPDSMQQFVEDGL